MRSLKERSVVVAGLQEILIQQKERDQKSDNEEYFFNSADHFMCVITDV